MPADITASASRPPRGRRPGRNATRQAVLDAARARFASDGFKAATIRRIAADAGVDAALVMQFFRSKDELFAAVMSISPEALARFADAFDGPEESLGQRVVRAHLNVWESDSKDAAALLAMLRGALANEQATAQLREFIESRLTEETNRRALDDHDSAVRVALAASMLIGVVVGRRVVEVPLLAGEDTESIVERVGPALQELLVPRPRP
ncbi:TetR/AcrR family transcriptional regulator [Streptomyces tsukubensis]|uniref:TetR family transcriptional regulator n=1 Tax=Streptomyces tsukubensis TaxID=83656 RepID=A0A1V4A051_9ACTN|nr:TetR/AcrR family transcriptional regulator [Streptomyces tsukubensis]OON72174.1 TetR family transcriptional regulator [Streptomyces tsukubensis]QFR97090.1 TetR family transcriptional regulator [Streptomyces tsukubensis]